MGISVVCPSQCPSTPEALETPSSSGSERCSATMFVPFFKGDNHSVAAGAARAVKTWTTGALKSGGQGRLTYSA